MKEPKFKIGEQCYFNFELVTVKKTYEDRIEQVSDGIFSCNSYDLSGECFPVNDKIKNISEYTNKLYKQLNNLHANLNYPEIRRRFEETWVNMCNNINNDKELEGLTMGLANFFAVITSRCSQVKHMEVDGIKIFK